MTDTGQHTHREGSVQKKLLFVALVTLAVVALAVTPAFAEGYNSPTEYTRATGYFAGPHGGYTTTTNKCADCHSTHYAAGTFMLLRANSREAACDYCHGGGGGSTINIMMDNDYRDGSYNMTMASAETTTSRGYGTGHTLGYAGNSPTDINPAYSDPDGLACFDCHTPHGNSARVMTTFSNPGRAMGVTGTGNSTVLLASASGWGNSTDGTLDTAGEWGLDPAEGNIKIFSGGVVQNKPIWPTGRFLLLKNPDRELVGGTEVLDTVVSDNADNGQNKLAINWDEPLGPADEAYAGEQDNDPDADFAWATDGFLALSEFCTDCHDGTGGASTQRANVWVPDDTNSAAGSYQVASSHDAQPRH